MATKKNTKFDPEALIRDSSWKEIQETVRTCTEAEALALMNAEKAGKNRSQWVNRFHQRFNKLRGQREKRELAVL